MRSPPEVGKIAGEWAAQKGGDLVSPQSRLTWLFDIVFT
jgi:hypothetical protein